MGKKFGGSDSSFVHPICMFLLNQSYQDVFIATCQVKSTRTWNHGMRHGVESVHNHTHSHNNMKRLAMYRYYIIIHSTKHRIIINAQLNKRVKKAKMNKHNINKREHG